MSGIEIVHSEHAPKAVGPYSQAVKAGGMLYASGQIGLDPATGNMAGADVGTQARQVLRNLSAVLAAAGLGVEDVVKVTIFLADMEDFAAVNAIYAEWLGGHRPARATVEVSRLPLDARVEMDLVARLRD
ncbi:MAG: RidA family protein [Mariprofundaceae bacterium]